MTARAPAIIASLLVFASAAPLVAQPAPQIPKNPITWSPVFAKEKQGYKNIRIPAICRTKEGTLLAFAEGREAGDTGDIDTILRRSEDDGKTWSDLQVVWSDKANTCGNPTPVVDQDSGTIWLFLTWNDGGDSEKEIMTGKSKTHRIPYLTFSKDDGKTWAEPKEMPHLRKADWRWYATGPGNGIQLTRGPHKGRIVIPANHSDKITEKRDSNTYRSHILYSDDHGKTWNLGGVQGPLTNESTVVELIDGSVMQNMRSYHGKGNRAAAISNDGGETFSHVYLEEGLPSPVCQGNILRYSWPEDGESKIFFSSPTGTHRSFLTIRTSYDEGQTWPVFRTIHAGPSAYSNLVWLPDNKIGILYEAGFKDPYEGILFAAIELKWYEFTPNEKTRKPYKPGVVDRPPAN